MGLGQRAQVHGGRIHWRILRNPGADPEVGPGDQNYPET